MSPDRGLFAPMGGAAPASRWLLAMSPQQRPFLTDQTQDPRPTATSAPLPAPRTGTGEGLRSGSPGLGRQCQGPASRVALPAPGLDRRTKPAGQSLFKVELDFAG